MTYWDWTLVPVLGCEGEVDFLVFSLRNVTPREEAEQKVRAASRYARSLLEGSLDPLVTISPEGKITDVNRATELVTGVDRGQLIGSSFSDYFTEPERAQEGYRKVIQEGQVHDYPLTIRHRSGRTTDVLYNAAVFHDESGNVQGVLATARDITERKAMERVLQRSEARYRSLVTATAQIIWTTDATGQVFEDIPSWRNFTGQTFEDIRGAGWTEAVHPMDRERVLGIWQKAIQSRSHYEAEYQLRRRDGTYHHFVVRGVPVLAPDGTIREWIGACTDVSARKAAEAELDRYREHLEELVGQRTAELETANGQLQREIAERERTEAIVRQTAQDLARSNRDLEQFAYVASHDLQEPLRAWRGYMQLLQRRYQDKLDAPAHKFIAGATDGAIRMQNLIDDLLSFSRVGTRGKEFHPANLEQALQNALKSLRIRLQETGAKVTHEPLPTLSVDATQITQVFQNLIGNALKFRADRVPEVHVSAQPEEGQWSFAVRDNGVGIEPQYFERVFQIFQRLHTRREYPGTGIGLAICKRIVERHGGAIWVESQPGQGATFHFTIPEPGT